MKGIRQLRQAAAEATRRAFLPAAMELEASPASPLGRGLLWTIMSLFTLAVVWACIGRVDVIAVAEGTLLPAGKVRTLQPASPGTVTAIHAANGDRVSRGQPLVTLDGTLTGADVRRLEEAVRGRVQRQNRLRALIRGVDELLAASRSGGIAHIPADLPDDPLLAMELQALQATDFTLRQQRDARQGELAYAETMVRRNSQTLPLIEERTEAVRVLQEDALAPRMEWLELQQTLIEARGQLRADTHRVEQLRAEIREIDQRREQLHLDMLRDTLRQEEHLREEIKEYRQELVKARELHRQQVLRAPVSGIVHESRLNTLGAVVQPAEPLLEIIPDDEPLVVEAWILNRDIGFVREGQAASLKVQTFEFTRYGTVPGTLVHLSRDAVVDEQAGPRYLARIELERDWMEIDDQRVRFTPGMSISAEIAIGQRRLIEFFAAPIVSAFNEAGRER